jgi:outer membrane protein assembly factor BamB
MRRIIAGLALSAAAAATATAQSTAPPSVQALDRLGLRTEWTSAVPLTGEQDGIATVQVADDRQVFVQTKGGLLVAFDARTGERQWTFRYSVVDRYPVKVAFNKRYVFASSTGYCYGIQRLNGVLDFTQKLPSHASAGPAADERTLYVPLVGNRLAAYELPAELAIPDPKLVKAANALDPKASNRIPGLQNPADVVAGRYPGTQRNLSGLADSGFESRKIRLTAEPAGGLGGQGRTPSLSVVHTLRPPFSAFDENGHYLDRSESVGLLHSLRQPFSLSDPTSKNVQRTPSIAAIPPSLAVIYETTNLRPRGIELYNKWMYGSVHPIAYTPLQTKSRLWTFSNARTLAAIVKDDRATEVDAVLTGPLTAQPVQALDVGYLPQNDGYMVAYDLTAGSSSTIRILWKSNVGGMMNRQPVVTADSIYQPGSHAGIARIDAKTGTVVWRTETASDQLLAVNAEHLYARDHLGRIYVYNRNVVNDSLLKKAYPIATADLPDFNIAVSNEKTDRVYLASDRGLFVCLRDAAPKYAQAMAVAPPAQAPPPPPKAAPKADPAGEKKDDAKP